MDLPDSSDRSCPGGDGQDTVAGVPPDFAARLAAPTATPGGGAAAARTGLFSTSLLEMVTGLTLAKCEGARSKFPDAVAEVDSVAVRARELAGEFRRLERADIAAFSDYMTALRLPKGTPAEKATRRVAVRDAAVSATQVPLRTLEAALGVLELAGRLLQAASTVRLRAESDLGGAVELAHAAFRTAELNVRTNLQVLRETPECAKLEERFRRLRDRFDQEYPVLRRGILEWLEGAS